MPKSNQKQMASAKWFRAAEDGDLEYIVTHIEELACSIDERGETALMCAVRQRNIEMVRSLIDHESRCINPSGQSALIIAIMVGFQDAVETLLPQEYDMGVIPGQLNPLDVAEDCGDDGILSLVRKYGDISAEQDCSTNHAALGQQMATSQGNDDDESASPHLSPDSFKTISRPICKTSSDTVDLDLCKAAIWKLANKAMQSQDEFESQFMAIQKRMEDVILRYKQEVRIMRKALELAGISGRTLQNYLQRAKVAVDGQEKTPSPHTLSIHEAIKLDSALTPPVVTPVLDSRDAPSRQSGLEQVPIDDLPKSRPSPVTERMENNKTCMISQNTVESLLTTYAPPNQNPITNTSEESEPGDLESQIILLSKDIKKLNSAIDMLKDPILEDEEQDLWR